LGVEEHPVKINASRKMESSGRKRFAIRFTDEDNEGSEAHQMGIDFSGEGGRPAS
jgi:hypothetical protein